MNSDDMNDQEPREAVEASLRDANVSEDNANSTPERQNHRVVDLTGESDDEVTEVFPKSNSKVGSETEDDEEGDGDLARAIKMSMQGTGGDDDLIELTNPPRTEDHRDLMSSPSNDTAAQHQKLSQPMGLLGLDRKRMEEERLARMAKRKASSPPTLDQNGSKYLKTGGPTKIRANEQPPKSARSRTQSAEPKIPSNQTISEQQAVPSNKPGIQFPNGVVKKTWAFGFPRQGDDIKLEEVFQQSDLTLAILSSFLWDMDFLFSKLDTRRVRFLLIMQAKEEPTVSQIDFLCRCVLLNPFLL